MSEQTDATEIWDGQLLPASEATMPEWKRLRESQIERAYAAAAADPLFMQDLHDCMRDYAEIDHESLQYIDAEWPDEEAS